MKWIDELDRIGLEEIIVTRYSHNSDGTATIEFQVNFTADGVHYQDWKRARLDRQKIDKGESDE